MDPIIYQQHIASLILKEGTTGLSAGEREELAGWRGADVRNEQLYRRLRQRDFSGDLRRYEGIRAEEGWRRYCGRYAGDGGRRQAGQGDEARRVNGRRRVVRRRQWTAAAAVVLILGFSALLLQYGGGESVEGQAAGGGNHAVLVLSDGRTVDLGKEAGVPIVSNREIAIRHAGRELQYSAAEGGDSVWQEKYNEVIIPRGGELVLTLADGSKVWLNSQSKLKYPVVFCGARREVHLEGEAYFEVAKDKAHPFHVHTGRGVSVEVLGTSFNVRSYEDEAQVAAVLEEGSVRMRQGEESVVLVPGQQAVCRDDGGGIRVASVDTDRYTAWRRGEYVFANERLEDILRQLARWYDLEVFYSSEDAKEVPISGDVQRYDDIGTLLEALEVAGKVSLELNGRTLVVGNKR